MAAWISTSCPRRSCACGCGHRVASAAYARCGGGRRELRARYHYTAGRSDVHFGTTAESDRYNVQYSAAWGTPLGDARICSRVPSITTPISSPRRPHATVQTWALINTRTRAIPHRDTSPAAMWCRRLPLRRVDQQRFRRRQRSICRFLPARWHARAIRDR